MKGYNFRILQCSLLIDNENQKKPKVCARQGPGPFRLFFRLSNLYHIYTLLKITLTQDNTFRNLEHYKKKTKQEI